MSDNLVASLLEALGLQTPQKQRMIEYLGTTVVPVLLPGLRRLARRLMGQPGDESFETRASIARAALQQVVAPLAESLRHIYCARPADPIDGLAVALFRRSDEDALRWLAQFLMRHNPRHATSFPLEKAVWTRRIVEKPEPPDEPTGVLRRERRILRYGLEEREFEVVVKRDENVHFVCTAGSLSIERIVSESELHESLTSSKWRVSTAEAAADLAKRIRITHSKAANSPLVIEFAPSCERLATTARVFDGAVYVLDVLREQGDVAVVAYDPAVSTAVELRLPNQRLATSLDDAKRQVERVVRRLCWRHKAPALELAAPHDRDVLGGGRLEVAAYAVVSNDDVVTLEITGRPHGEPATSIVVVAEAMDIVATDEPVQALLDGLRYEAGHLTHERQSSPGRIDDGTVFHRSFSRRRQRQVPECDADTQARRDDVLRRRRDRQLRKKQRLDVNGGFVAHRQVQDFGRGQYRVVSVVVLARAASGALKFEAYDPTTSESRCVQAEFVDTRGFFEPDAKAVARLARRYCRRLRFEEDGLVLWQKDALTTKLRRVFDGFDEKDLRGRVAKRDVADVFDITHTHLDTFLKAATSTSHQSRLPPLLDAPTADAARACLGRAQSRLASATHRLSFPSFAATLCETILDDD